MQVGIDDTIKIILELRLWGIIMKKLESLKVMGVNSGQNHV